MQGSKVNLNFNTTHQNISQVIPNHKVDLSSVEAMDLWSFVLVWLLLVEFSEKPDEDFILPSNPNTLRYLRRMRLDELLMELGYDRQSTMLSKTEVLREDSDVQELSTRCNRRDEFDVRLGRFLNLFEKFGLHKDDARRATALIGELGNNVFDHNSGNWPTNIPGCVIAVRNYLTQRRLEVVVGDPGIGFLGSLKAAFPEIKTDVEAVKKGLAGYTGRVGERRGNGLRLIQDWTVNNFSGELAIQSGRGLVVVTKKDIKESDAHVILGTLAKLVLNYG